MNKVTMTMAIALSLAMTASADFPNEFKSAFELYSKKEYPQAQEAFQKLAETAPTPKSKSECLAYAALSLGRQGNYDRALELARKIEVKPIAVNCQMEIMLENKKYKELVEAFGDENISSWPDYIIHRGFYNRGTAERLAGNNEAAAADLEKAVENSDTAGQFQTQAAHELAGVCRALKNDEKELSAHRVVLSQKPDRIYIYYPSSLAAAGILLKQGKLDEALAELKRFDPLPPDGPTAPYKARALEMYGDIYAKQCKTEMALSSYNAALKSAVGKAETEVVNKKIGELQGDKK